MSELTTPFRAWWDRDTDVVRVDWAPGSVVDLPAAQAATAAVRALGRDRVQLMIDIRGVKVFEHEARGHFLHDQAGGTAIALLAGSAVNRMLANFFIGMQRLAVPVKMFTAEEAALRWLHEQR